MICAHKEDIVGKICVITVKKVFLHYDKFLFHSFPFNFHILKSEGFYLRISKTGIFLGLGLLLKGKLLSEVMVVTANILFLYWFGHLGLLLKSEKPSLCLGLGLLLKEEIFCLRLGLVLKKLFLS